MIVDRTFDANNQIPYNFDIDPGTQGDTFLVNGVPQFRVTRDLTETSSVPATLRPAPTFPAPVRDRQFVIGNRTDAAGNIVEWQFNGRSFDPGRFDADPVPGTTERWTFLNTTTQPHGIHIHDVDWRLTARFQLTTDPDGNPLPGAPLPIDPAEDGLKETWSVPAGTGFSVTTTFTDHTGPYVLHCHMLEHEDFALMAQFNVMTLGKRRVPAGVPRGAR